LWSFFLKGLSDSYFLCIAESTGQNSAKDGEDDGKGSDQAAHGGRMVRTQEKARQSPPFQTPLQAGENTGGGSQGSGHPEKDAGFDRVAVRGVHELNRKPPCGEWLRGWSEDDETNILPGDSGAQ
jgi:hypothetical protein